MLKTSKFLQYRISRKAECCAVLSKLDPSLLALIASETEKKLFVMRYDLAKTCLMFTMCLLYAFARLFISQYVGLKQITGIF